MSFTRRPSVFVLAALVGASVATAFGQTAAPRTTAAEILRTAAVKPAANRPAWVEDSLHPNGSGHILSIQPGAVDVVVIDGGLYQNLRVGAPLVVERDGLIISQLIVVDSAPERAAALITLQAQDISLQAGDHVLLKTTSLR